VVNNFSLKTVAQYGGHSIKSNGNVDLTLRCDYSELVKYIQLVQALNNDVNIAIKIPDEKPFKLGVFRIKSIMIDHDGEGVLKFNGQTDFVEVDNLTRLVGCERFNVKFNAEIEVEEAEAGEDNDD
jgi:hypothetical protein